MNIDTCIEYLKNSATAVFQTMLGIDVAYQTVEPLDTDASGLDVSGVITLTAG